MPALIGSDRILIDYDDSFEPQMVPEGYVAVLAPPTLWGAFRILCAPTFQPGETYRRGGWYLKSGDLHTFIEELYQDKDRPFYKLFEFVSKFRGISFIAKQKLFTKYFTRKVRTHYELDPDIYAAILDEEMVYTCGFFEQNDDSLLDAQYCKLDRLLDRMQLPRGKISVLELGSGWGSFSRRLVMQNDLAEYVGLTISKEQIVRAKELDNQRLTGEQNGRITYRLEDYLDHECHVLGGYDGIAVIGMMEHVGLGDYPNFLQKICSLLKPDRRAVIHTIIANKSGEPTNSWIDRHIFPGGYAPALAEVLSAAESINCKIEAVFTHEPENYRRTIEAWAENFLLNWQQYREDKISDWPDSKADELFRIWYFYLSAVRNMFSPGAMDFRIAHFVIRKP